MAATKEEKMTSAQSIILENGYMRIDLDEDSGRIVALTNKLADETYLTDSLGFRLETDKGIFDTNRCSLNRTSKTATEATFVYKRDGFELELRYTLEEDNNFLQKQVSITGPEKQQFVVKSVVMGSMLTNPEFKEVIPYYVILECPFAMFLRGDEGGFFLGMEYPFFTMTHQKGRVQIAFDPNVVVKPGERFTTEKEFLGVAKLEGRVIGHFLPKKTGWAGRKDVPPNPEYVPLDWGEVRAVQSMTWKLLPPMLDGYQVVLDAGWAMLPNLYFSSTCGRAQYNQGFAAAYRSPKGVEEWCHAIDIAAQLGIEVASNLGGWYPYDLHYSEEAAEGFDVNEDAQRVLDYARSKGVKLGFYTGGGEPLCDLFRISSDLNFLPEKKDWKVLDASGQPFRNLHRLETIKGRGWWDAAPDKAGEINCIANKPFADWYLDVQDATIKKYGLGFWSWDWRTGPGTMKDWQVGYIKCYSEEHGHLPGDCTYNQWKNAMYVLRGLKERNPDVWIQTYWGHKRYGPWFLRYIDTHENVYELGPQNRDFIFPTIHLTQQYADAIRFQCWWNQNLRFLPPWKNYSFFSCWTTCRIARQFRSVTWDRQAGFSRCIPYWKSLEEIEVPSRREYLDEMSWRYGLLSAIAMGGALVNDILPEPEEHPEFFAFFKKWVNWARENNRYLQTIRSIFGAPEIGAVDGYAHVIGDRGFLFLFNPNARKKQVTISLDESIDLKTQGLSMVVELYPQEGRAILGPENGFFPYGSELKLTIPASQAVVLEIKPKDEEHKLFGVAGEVRVEENRVLVSSVQGEEGTEAKLWVKVENPQEISEFLVNEQPVPFQVEIGMLKTLLRFAGEPITRELDNWETDKHGRVHVENLQAMSEVTFSKTFFVPDKIRKILAKGHSAKASMQCEGSTPGPSPWGDMNRFIISIPLSGAYPSLTEAAGKVEAKLNGQPVSVQAFGEYCYYLDLTEIIRYGENNTLKLRFERLKPEQFLGPYIENLPVQMTDRLVTPP